ncbi:MAG: hypothetical protein JO317_01320 [Verrucomicrobiae bacterium]|nr:hypothetical protein [Verrucomicrobiae bacterium]
MPKRIVEVALLDAGVRNDGDGHPELGDNVLVAQLMFARALTGDAVVSTRPLPLRPTGKAGEQSCSVRGRGWAERLLFKRQVDGPMVGLKLEITDKDSGSKVAGFLLDLCSVLLGGAATVGKKAVGAMPLSGLVLDAAVSFAKTGLAAGLEPAEEDRIYSLGEGWLDLDVDTNRDWTEKRIELIATRDFSQITYVREQDPISSKPRWRTRIENKVVVKAGDVNGWVTIASRVYPES